MSCAPPIAALRAQAEVALGASSDEERRHALQGTLQGCDRASRLVQQMLMLARLDAPGLAQPAAVDLSALARQVAADLAPLALAKVQTLSLEGADASCPAQGDADLLALLLRNLLDNAIRYSPRGAVILLSLQGQVDGHGASLTLEDGGPGLEPAQLARLGERFFRVAGQELPGSGLGWSIIRRIAEAHGASLATGRSERLGGLSVTLRWPAAR